MDDQQRTCLDQVETVLPLGMSMSVFVCGLLKQVKKIDACMDGVCKLWLVIGDHLALLHFLCLLLYV